MSEQNQKLLRENELLRQQLAAFQAREKEWEQSKTEQAKCKLLIENLSTGIYILQEGIVIFANPAASAMFGYQPEDINKNLGLQELIHPDEIQIALQQHQQRLAGTLEEKSFIYKVVRQDGSPLYVEVFAMGINIEGKPATMGTLIDVTDRIWMEKQVKASEEKFRLAMEATQIGLWDWGIAENQIYCSPGIFNIVSEEPVQISIQDWQAYIHPEDKTHILQTIVKEHIDGKTSYWQAEYRIHTKDGNWKWVESRGQIVARDENGNALRMMGTMADISHRKEAESQLRYQAALLEDISDAVISFDNDFRITTWNKAAERIYEWKAEEVIGKLFGEVIPAIYPYRQHTEVISEFQASGQWQGEVIHPNKSGEEIPLFAAITTLVDEKGKPIGAVAVNRDMTRLKLMETQASENETRFQALFDNAGYAIFTHKAGKTVMVNAAYLRLFGYSDQSELIEKPLIEQIAPQERERVQQIIDNRISGKPAPSFYETIGIRKDGTTFDMDIRISSYTLKDEVYNIGIIRNISAYKSAEEQLGQLREQLAHASRINAMGEMASALAHELNQPLTAIVSNAQAAKRFLSAPQPDLQMLQEILVDISEEGQRAGAIIHSMRQFLRKSNLKHQPLDLATILAETQLLIGDEARLRSVKVSFDVEKHLPPITGNRIQMQQVILNLLSNAVDACSQVQNGKKVVDVRAYQESAKTITVVVQDSGIGLQDDELERIFDPFYTTKPAGMGMGLAISKSIVEAHGGQLFAEHNTVQGISVIIRLPILTEQAP